LLPNAFFAPQSDFLYLTHSLTLPENKLGNWGGGKCWEKETGEEERKAGKGLEDGRKV